MGQPSNTNDRPEVDPVDPVDQDQDQPPSYDDATDLHRSPRSSSFIPGARRYHSVFASKRGSGTVTLFPSLTDDATELHRLITQQAPLPPQPHLQITGYHKETRRHGNENREETVTDFDFQLDLTRTLLGRTDTGEWHDVHVIHDGDGQKAYRGGRLKSRSRREPSQPKAANRPLFTDLEEGEDQNLVNPTDDELGEGSPSLLAWCERFCSDPVGVKSFTLTRVLHGFDEDPMRSVFTSHLRSLNYRGSITISASLANGSITVYSRHWINKLRNNPFVFWACIILQLWILTWPLIWLLERRYEVVRSMWWSSREVQDPGSPSGWSKAYANGRNETQLAEYWCPAVAEMAWAGCTAGEVLTERDVARLQRIGRQRMEQMRWEEPLNWNLMMGNSMTGGMLGRMRGVQGGRGRRGNNWMNFGMGGWNLSMGWGGR